MSYRLGALVTFVRTDGGTGPGETFTFAAADGWQVEIRDEGCVEINRYLAANPPPSRLIPWHRIWEITTIPR